MSPALVPQGDKPERSRFDRLALRIAEQSPVPVAAPPARPAVGGEGQLPRRKLLTRALAACGLVMLPLRLANPTTAHADSYCAARCLDDANATAAARGAKCSVSSFGIDFPDQKAFAAYVAAKIRSGGLGGLVVLNEIAKFDGCVATAVIRYQLDAGQCGSPNCGDRKRYPPIPGCEACGSNLCCVCSGAVVAAGCLPSGAVSSCDQTCAACRQSKAGGFDVQGRC